jgi:hypothetical protein
MSHSAHESQFPRLKLSTITTIFVLLRFQSRRRRNETTPTLIYPIRNVLFEWEYHRSIPRTDPLKPFDYSKSLLAYIDLRTCRIIQDSLQHEKDVILERYNARDESFNLYTPLDDNDLPDDRLPATGISHAGNRYHSIPSASSDPNRSMAPIINESDFIENPDVRSQIQFSETLDLTGDPPHPRIAQIIHDWFPVYEQYLAKYCRPASYGPQAFHDFNRPTPTPAPPTPERHEQIMSLVRAKMAIQPYRPLHYVDALAAETPLNTSASYYSKFNPESKIFARHSAPTRYSSMPTSKGYNFNVMLNQFRLEYHHIKYDGMPFPTDNHDPEANLSILQTWFDKHPAQLFIRTQISLRNPSEPKKIRPVYSVDDRFLHLEKSLFTPALAQLRNPECCVAHGLETFRGSMSLLNQAAMFFLSYISLDWSQYDQRLPYYVIIAFFLDYLPSLLIVSHGYMPTRLYPNSSQPLHSFARKIFNLVIFLLVFYLSMRFLSFDGFAYIREHGGVPSGLLNTQFLDSFGNMYIIADCLLEFGFTHEECLQMLFCVLGDDNLIYLREHIDRTLQFAVFLDHYANQRHGMVLSILKSVITNLRTKITFLSYENTEGMPTRPIGKLVAQLAFPERPVPEKRNWIHAARALGLAYASCGQDMAFHLLCKIVYEEFRPADPVSVLHIDKIFKKWKFQLPEFDIQTDEYSFPDFPTLYELRQNVSSYHGPFSETDKWNFNLFNVPPSDNLTDYVTLKDYILTDPDLQSTVQRYWQGKRTL